MDAKIETVQKLQLQPGDILHIKVGGDIMVNDSPITWIPSSEDLVALQDAWLDVLPPGVQAILTHHLIEPQIIQSRIRCSTWPPRVSVYDPA